MTDDMVEDEVEERVRVKRCLLDLQKSGARKRKVSESVLEAVGLAVELVDDAVVALLLGRGLDNGSRIDELTEQLATIRAEFVSIAAMTPDLLVARDMAVLKHENVVRKTQTEKKTSEDIVYSSRTVVFLAIMVFCDAFGESLKRLMSVVTVVPICLCSCGFSLKRSARFWRSLRQQVHLKKVFGLGSCRLHSR